MSIVSTAFGALLEAIDLFTVSRQVDALVVQENLSITALTGFIDTLAVHFLLALRANNSS